MHILGLSCYFPDASAAILPGGLLVAAAEEERFSRVKHDFGFPSRAIEFCLAEAGIQAKVVRCPAYQPDRLKSSVLRGELEKMAT